MGDPGWLVGKPADCEVICDDYHNLFVMKGHYRLAIFVVQWNYHCTSIGEYYVQNI